MRIIMKKMYLILTNSETVFSKFLRLFTKNYYNHVAFTFDDDFNRMYTFARWVTWLPLFSGFEIENINKGVLKKKPQTECRIHEIWISDEEYNAINIKMERFLASPKLMHWYNFAALPCIQFNLPYRSQNSFVCSTFVAYILSDILNFKKKYSYVTPNDYTDLRLPIKYEGVLAEYILERRCKAEARKALIAERKANQNIGHTNRRINI